jgi:hypothetical protein
VKVLFIGEGRHDIGDANPDTYQPRPAGGVVPALMRRVCPGVAGVSIALAWPEIRRFNPSAEKSGYPAKTSAAVLLATTKFDCGGTVLVADRDTQASRESELEEGVMRARQLFPNHPIVWGSPVESVEAWTLGVPEKIAAELDVDVKLVKEQYPPGIHVESLSERSGKVGHRPKRLLERIAQLKHRDDSTEFRQSIAERTDAAILEQACPKGFAPFAERLRKGFVR